MLSRFSCFALLVWLVGCDHAVPRSAVAAEEWAIQQASLFCQSSSSDFSWLRQRIRTLEKAPFAQQQFVLVFTAAKATYFATGSTASAFPSPPLFNCRGQLVRRTVTSQRQLTGTVIYAPPIHRR
ncbi:hypothetical protein [Spirosoma rigui]|uniref:hypothetical protein n=1 Tax=Spirosoma rigui TaxID=564064 RepID=UPI0009B09B46|nr:hypothetical protein [Spirosoma rigui]